MLRSERVTVRVDSEIGLVRPEFHGHFAEHLGSCVYGGLWVGIGSSIPNVDGYRKLAIDYLKELGVPVLPLSAAEDTATQLRRLLGALPARHGRGGGPDRTEATLG